MQVHRPRAIAFMGNQFNFVTSYRRRGQRFHQSLIRRIIRNEPRCLQELTEILQDFRIYFLSPFRVTPDRRDVIYVILCGMIHALVIFCTNLIIQLLFRNSTGDMPTLFLNMRVKWLEYSKPSESAMMPTGSSEARRRCFATPITLF